MTRTSHDRTGNLPPTHDAPATVRSGPVAARVAGFEELGAVDTPSVAVARFADLGPPAGVASVAVAEFENLDSPRAGREATGRFSNADLAVTGAGRARVAEFDDDSSDARPAAEQVSGAGDSGAEDSGAEDSGAGDESDKKAPRNGSAAARSGRANRSAAPAGRRPRGRSIQGAESAEASELTRQAEAEWLKADPDADPEAVARTICLRLLTARARTRQELAQALRRKGVPDEAAGAVLERFDDVGLIDDGAFAEQWVRSRHAVRGLGRRALAVELRRKGVADDIAGEALAGVDTEAEDRRARELVDRKLRTIPADTEEQRVTAGRRLVGMLARKGYSGGTAYRVVREALAARGAELDEFPDTDSG
ncbi:MAG: RecX family transcriptional regulator [Pseudonocardia sp.]